MNGALRRASARPDETVIEEGTEIQVRLEDRVSSATARREDRLRGVGGGARALPRDAS